MVKYIKSEILKQKNTFARKIVWIAPIITLLISILSPLWYQINSYNWWYMIMYPGFLTLLCALIIQRDDGKLKYQAIYLLPVELNKIWYGKIAVCVYYSFISNVIFMIFNFLGGFIIYKIYQIPMSITVVQTMSATLFITLLSIWSIPICLFVSKKIGIFICVIINVGLNFTLSALISTEKYWILCPYSWVARFMVPVLKILPNGEPTTSSNLFISAPLKILVIIISITLFCIYIILFMFGLSFGKSASIGVGIVGSLISALMLTGLGDKVWKFIPWAWGVRFVDFYFLKYIDYTTYSYLIGEIRIGKMCAIIISVILFVYSLIWFNFWECTKGNE